MTRPRRRKERATKHRTETHRPLRTCIGCRSTAEIDRLVRCVATVDGAAVSRTLPGRGAWLCSARCLATARKRKAFARAWRRPVEDAVLDELMDSFEAALAAMRDLSAPGTAREQTPMKG